MVDAQHVDPTTVCLEVVAAYGVRAGRAPGAARTLGLAKALRDLLGARV